MIYHIATPQAWQQALQQGFYVPDAFETEGFIHACRAEQIESVLEKHFKGISNLLVLHLDEKKLTAPHAFVFAAAVNDEFPHIFGSINLDAIEEVTALTD